jgi:sigma-B regulation protein RsbU (phosphoserine phosphatase)
LLTALVLLGYLFVVGIVGHLMTRAFQVSTYPLVIIIVAASGLVVLPLRRTAQHWVDRAFYPARLANRSAIVQLGDELTGIIDRDAAVELLLDRLMHLYRPRTLALYLSEGDASVLVPVATRLMDGAERVPERLAAGSGLARYLDRIRRPVFAEELEDLLAVDSAPGISLELLAQLESELLVPLVTGNRLTGFISLGAKTGGRLYGQEDLANLRTLALQLASLLESRRLYEESLAREQLETELKVAREIQSQLLPDAPLTQPGVAMCGRTEPCRAVGGDYFDYFELGEDRVGFCIADVAGKGIPAALLMSSLRVSFRGAAVDGTAPEDVLGRLNRVAAELLAPGQFVCFFYGVLSTRDGLLRYCNAGIDPPLLLRRDGVIERLKKGGPVLGILAEHNYRRGTLALKPDDLLLLYTDGITEQRNAEGEFYDVERLLAVLGAHIRPPVSDGPLEKLLETIFTSVDVFGGNDRSDDRTVILLRRSTL